MRRSSSTCSSTPLPGGARSPMSIVATTRAVPAASITLATSRDAAACRSTRPAPRAEADRQPGTQQCRARDAATALSTTGARPRRDLGEHGARFDGRAGGDASSWTTSRPAAGATMRSSRDLALRAAYASRASCARSDDDESLGARDDAVAVAAFHPLVIGVGRLHLQARLRPRERDLVVADRPRSARRRARSRRCAGRSRSAARA